MAFFAQKCDSLKHLPKLLNSFSILKYERNFRQALVSQQQHRSYNNQTIESATAAQSQPNHAYNQFSIDKERTNSSKESTTSYEELPATCWREQVLFVDEIMDTLAPEQNPGIYLDMTLGAGSHTRAILERCPTSKVIAVDRDPATQETAKALQREFPSRLCFLNIRFSEVARSLHTLGLEKGSLSGVILDAGPSREQLEDPSRGFSDTTRHRLDMRMDGPNSAALSAQTVIQNIEEQDLHRVLRNCGGIDRSRKLARAIVQARYEMHRVTTPRDLVELVCGIHGVVPSVDQYRGYVHSCAVNTFQALRMLVNDEARELDAGLRGAHWLLRPGRPLAALSHSLQEDALLKTHVTGMNVDAVSAAAPATLAKFHKASGSTPASDCLPWTPLTKHVQKLHWQTRLEASFWKNTKLRTAVANPGVVYC